MQIQLKRQYFMLIGPALGLFVLFALAGQAGFFLPGQFALPSFCHAMVFVLAACTGIAGPIFIRTLFAHAHRHETQVEEVRFMAFQKRLLWVSQTTLYLAFVAVFFSFPRFYAGAVVLIALYSLYYYFPSSYRIDFDRKVFRVK